MINLAGNMGRDVPIALELAEAGIDLVCHSRKLNNEVPANLTGELRKAGLTFERGWYYWIVKGEVPIKLARQMYAVEERRDVRVAGHCGSPSPDEWAIPSEKDLQRISEEEGVSLKFIANARSVHSYHIDTQEGLNFFVSSVKQYFGIKD